MDDLYVKDAHGHFTPITLEVASTRDLVDKLVLVTVGNDEQPADEETLEHVLRRFMQSNVLKEAMKRSKDANLLILPHIIKLELISKRDLDTKTVCIRVNSKDDLKDLPEIKDQLQDELRREVIILPAPLSLNEYKEFKAIKERVSVRKQRSGGGLNTKGK